MKKFYLSFTVLAILSTQFYCTKFDTTDLGVNLLPVVDNVNTFDTILNVETDLMELVDTSRVPLGGSYALGALNDGGFGTTQAGIYFSITPSIGYGTHPFRAKDSVDDNNIDSVVLQLAYNNIYGDTTSILNFEVREINTGSPNKFKDSLGYPTNISTSFFNPNSLLGSISQKMNELNDSRIITNKANDTSIVSNVLRIRLNQNFGRRLKNYDTTASSNFAYKNDSIFREQLQGLAVVCTSNPSLNSGALGYFNLQNANTKLLVYYRYKKGASLSFDTLQTAYVANFARANLLQRNNQYSYASTLNSPVTNEPALYLQSSTGSYASIKIPGLNALSNRVIHRAELIIERLPDPTINIDDYPFDTPQLLFLDAVDSANSNRSICIPNDFLAANNSLGYDILSFGGDEKNKAYRINLSRYVQGIVTRKDRSYTLRLYTPFTANCYYTSSLGTGMLSFQTNNFIGSGRVVIGGGSNADPTKKMRLRIIYSKI